MQGTLSLAVSHGIFSKGVEVLTDQFDYVFTTNSFKDFDHDKLYQFPL